MVTVLRAVVVEWYLLVRVCSEWTNCSNERHADNAFIVSTDSDLGFRPDLVVVAAHPPHCRPTQAMKRCGARGHEECVFGGRILTHVSVSQDWETEYISDITMMHIQLTVHVTSERSQKHRGTLTPTAHEPE